MPDSTFNPVEEIAISRGKIAIELLCFEKLSHMCPHNRGPHTKPGVVADACVFGVDDIKADSNAVCNPLTCPIEVK
jgi:hypothetical protein